MRRPLLLTALASSLLWTLSAPADSGADPGQDAGRRMYMQGERPDGGLMNATVRGDIPVSGNQAICGYCHRRSGLGSSEGQEVVPPVAGDVLFQALRLPTSKPPLAPVQRPAYTDETLRRAIRDGLDANGEPLSPLMPRYDLTDEELDTLIGYLKQLSTQPDPGVSDEEIHFATVLSADLDPAKRKAFLDVFEAFFAQKNANTRNEERRAVHAPWHKQWAMAPYRKWVLHVWELKGEPGSWPQQLQAQYQQQPVFALLSGMAPGSWEPVHRFCQSRQLPCTFPITDLPVIDEADFYPLYLSRGMTLEAETVAERLLNGGVSGGQVVQVYREGDPRGTTAAAALERRLRESAVELTTLPWAAGSPWPKAAGQGGPLVLWLGDNELAPHWDQISGDQGLFLSEALYGGTLAAIPEGLRGAARFVVRGDLGNKRRLRLQRSTGWLRFKRIYDAETEQLQADLFFTLSMTGGVLKEMGAYYKRDYFLEQFEHMTDNATYTSVYPRMSLAPGQRFVVKGAHIARLSEGASPRLIAGSEWIVPRSR